MTLQYDMNRLAGTLVGDVPTHDAAGAANIWAGTTGLELVGALNVRAGNAVGNYRELMGVLNQLAGTTGLEVDGAAAAITTAYVQDSFTRADSSTSLGTADSGQAWSAAFGTWGISTNKAITVGANASAENVALIEASHADYTLSCDLTYDGTAPGTWQRLVFRATDASNFYMIQMQNATGFQVYKRVAGTYTQIGTGTGGSVYNSGQTYHVDVVLSGSSITVKLDGVTKWSLTDSTYTTQTKVGLSGATNPNFRWDNFSVVP